MTTETITVAGDGITIDLLVWRRFRARRDGLVERIIATNPGLAALGPILPVGTVVTIPMDDPAAAPQDRALVRLWD